MTTHPADIVDWEPARWQENAAHEYAETAARLAMALHHKLASAAKLADDLRKAHHYHTGEVAEEFDDLADTIEIVRNTWQHRFGTDLTLDAIKERERQEMLLEMQRMDEMT